jgi:hypothetical protein
MSGQHGTLALSYPTTATVTATPAETEYTPTCLPGKQGLTGSLSTG